MDFLVRIDTTAVHAPPQTEHDALLEREWARGRELHNQGTLRKLWRLPGQKGNVGIWTARDADELHQAIQSLPIWPLITVEITPLSTHPLFAESSRTALPRQTQPGIESAESRVSRS